MSLDLDDQLAAVPTFGDCTRYLLRHVHAFFTYRAVPRAVGIGLAAALLAAAPGAAPLGASSSRATTTRREKNSRQVGRQVGERERH